MMLTNVKSVERQINKLSSDTRFNVNDKVTTAIRSTRHKVPNPFCERIYTHSRPVEKHNLSTGHFPHQRHLLTFIPAHELDHLEMSHLHVAFAAATCCSDLH